MRNNGGEGLNVLSNMRHINIPILDIYGTSSKNTDFQDGQHRKKLAFPNATHQVLTGANHKFAGYGASLRELINDWVQNQL
jgi:hypothetical protein